MLSLLFVSFLNIKATIFKQPIPNRTATHTNSCYFTMVALDPDGSPLEIDALKPETKQEIRRYEAAIKRKEARSAKKKKS